MSLIDPIDKNALMVKLGIVKNCEACKYHETVYCSWKPNVVDVCEAICDAPTVEPEPHWIPVSEKAYPTKEGKYLVTDDAGGMATVEVDDFMYCDDGSGMWLCSQNVTAWKPVPKPYREEGETR